MNKAWYIWILLAGTLCLHGAAVMDGVDDYFIIDYWAPKGPGGFTVAFQLKLDRSVFLPEHRKRSYHIFELQTPQKNTVKIYFVNQSQGANAGYLAFVLGGAAPGQNARYNFLVPGGQPEWMDIVLSFGRGVFKVWIDQAEQSVLHHRQNIPEILPTESYRMYFGMTSWRGGRNHTPCSISDIVFFEKILQPSEIGVPVTELELPGLSGYFPLKYDWKNIVKRNRIKLTLPEAEKSRPAIVPSLRNQL